MNNWIKATAITAGICLLVLTFMLCLIFKPIIIAIIGLIGCLVWITVIEKEQLDVNDARNRHEMILRGQKEKKDQR